MEQDEQNKEKAQSAKEPEPKSEPKSEPAPQQDGMEEKYHIQVINLLQELCDLLKESGKADKKDSKDKDQTPDDDPDNYDDSDQFDNLLD